MSGATWILVFWTGATALVAFACHAWLKRVLRPRESGVRGLLFLALTLLSVFALVVASYTFFLLLWERLLH